MRTAIQIIFLLLAVSSSWPVFAAENPVFRKYAAALQKMATDCSLDYSTTLIYPNGGKQSVIGRMAMRGGYYLDSSNARFVFINDKWLLAADHQAQEINVLYIPSWKKEFGATTDLVTSSFMFSSEVALSFSSFKVSKGTKDTIIVQLRYDQPASPLRSLTLQYCGSSLVPVRYWGTVKISPTSGEDDENTNPADDATLQFSCYNITPGVPVEVFDDQRLIDYKGGKATLKRYNHYKMSRRKL